MREIKFRGFWKTVKGDWQYAIGNLSIVDNEERSGWFISNKWGSPFAYLVRQDTVGQYTGLNDKEDFNIFEGDIVEFNPVGSGDINTGVVEWRKDGWWIYPKSGQNFDYRLWTDVFGIKIIGNIYENPELLAEQT